MDFYRPPLLAPGAIAPPPLPLASAPPPLPATSKPVTTHDDATSAAAAAGRVLGSQLFPASLAVTTPQPHLVMNLAESQQRLAEVVLQQQEQQRAVEAALLQQKQNHRIFEAAIIQSHMLQVCCLMIGKC